MDQGLEGKKKHKKSSMDSLMFID